MKTINKILLAGLISLSFLPAGVVYYCTNHPNSLNAEEYVQEETKEKGKEDKTKHWFTSPLNPAYPHNATNPSHPIHSWW